jgi:uncharacterized protein (UPF0548 family)
MLPIQLDSDLEGRLRAAEFTYDHVAGTAGVLPAGYYHLHRRTALGLGTARFAETARLLFSWQIHLRSGLQVSTSSPTVEPHTVVVLGVHAGPFRLSAPCRVVYVIDEPNRQGFAYGTLPGHPESGEEAFVVEQRDDDTVVFDVRAFSRHSSNLAKLAGPLGRLAQRRMTDRYVRSLTDTPEVRE